MFPGAGSIVYYSDAGEPIGWDYPSEYDPNDDYDPYDDYDDDYGDEEF